ncbi:hypothetical protein ACFFU2_11455 [Halomonas alkalicola]|uniref:hypothetical protein n=1 Tax=Halomonas alkalicola TaxID=1930622 RepID=UPI0035EDA545
MPTFEVDDSGTLSLAGYEAPKTRSDIYDVDKRWHESPERLRFAMEDCPALMEAVHNIYSRYWMGDGPRGARTSKQRKLIDRVIEQTRHLASDPEDGMGLWFMMMGPETFQEVLVADVNDWLSSDIDWTWDDTSGISLPLNGQDAAYEYLKDLPANEMDAIGIVLVEGDVPGSSYYAAELTSPPQRATAAARALGRPLEFTALWPAQRPTRATHS